MQTPWLRLPVSPFCSFCVRAKGVLLLFFFCFITINGFAAVTVTTSSAGVNICSNKAVTGSAPGFTSLGTIMISEGSNADINGAAGGITNTIILVPPTGWQFGTTLPTFTFTTGSNVTAVTGSITSSSLTINITANNTNGGDQVFITGLQVQATSTTSASGNIYPTSVTGVAGIATGPAGTNFSSLSLITPVTPSVSIAASPAGAVCPGINVTFTPTPVNGGASPVYQWYVNGSSVATGAVYNSSSLANGNTVSCTMIPGLSCVTSTSATSGTITMTVNAAPAAITGSAVTCPGTSTSLSSATTGGAWSSGAASVATVNTSGVVSGVAAGSARISYTAGGCATTRTVYVNAVPSTPSLSPTISVICSGTGVAITAWGTPLPSSILSQNFNGGISPWIVDTTGSVGALPGSEWKSCGDGYINEQGIYHSPDNSAFAMSNSDTSGSASYTWSKLISPAFSLSGYSAATLSFQHAYEHWLAGDYNVDLEISTNGGASWSTLRSYTGNDVGMRTAFSADTISLNAYLGYSNVKVRFNYYCHWGYYWAVDNVMITGISSVVYPTWTPSTMLYTDSALTTPYVPGAQTNLVYASPGAVGSSAVVTYSATATIPGCSSSATSVVTVNPLPGTITGAFNTCTSTSTSLSNSVSGGVWSSVNAAVASINAATGVATGLTPGTSIISYSSGVCAATAVLTVNVTPAAITGPSGVCITSTSTLSDATTGGTWSSSNTSIATVGSATGIVNGMALGTAVITYSLGAGCTATKSITVNPLPAVITGTAVVCQGLTTTLADATSGGAWSSSTPGIAAVVVGTGVVTGISAGTATITYTSSAGCIAIREVTVNPLAPITGTLNVCVGLTTSLGNVNSGGTWYAATSLAWVGSAGVVAGIGAGTAVVTYALPTGCTATTVVTINPLPPAITGTTNVCVGLATTLSNTSTGGTWSSDNIAVANAAAATGVVNGVAAGSANVSYTLPTGCMTSTVVAVNPLPDVITGSNSVCESGSITLNDITTGGTWSSSNASVAGVGSGTGIVSGVLPGIVNITYTLPTTCVATKTITVNALPGPIVGPVTICQGTPITLIDGSPGGTWSSSDLAVGTVSMSTGVVGGIAPGTLTITYTLPTACYVTRTFTVNGLPDVISGPSSVCLGYTITLGNTVTGGSWSSASSNVSVNSTTGAVMGIAAGSAAITYTLPTGCMAVKNITVNSLPAAIAGPSNVCLGYSILLTDVTAGGTWSSSNTAAGTINATTGVLYGVGSGTTIISYTLPTGCLANSIVTVNTLPAPITGAGSVCLAASITLTDATAGGSWISSNASFALVGSSSGIVTGYTVGSAIITYMLPTGCFAINPVTINSLPLAISGPATVCAGFSILLTDLTSGGSWSSSNTSIAIVGSGSGVVAGVATGPARITYTLPTGCIATKNINVNTTPAAITGTTGVCQGSTTTLSDATGGGAWSVGTGTVAAVGPTSGVVTGLSPGTTLVSYTVGSCYATTAVTVNVVPPAILGLTTICQGVVSPLFNSVGGGSWMSASSVANIGSATGFVLGLGVGTTTISYTLPTGCYVTTPFTVNALPATIVGPTSLCVGSSAFYSNTTSGGTWSSSNTAAAGINSSGLVIAYAIGTSTISYSTGCGTAISLTVTPIPAAITGPSTVCEGMAITLSSSSFGGTWSSSNTSVAGVSTGGIVSGITSGTATISYTLGGCTVIKTVTVNAGPQPITGITSICFGVNTTLSSLSSGGTWSSGSGVATIGATSGFAVAVSPGTAIVTYTLGSGCITTAALVVSTVTPITGPASICVGAATTLSNSTTGGGWNSSNGAVATINATSGGVIGMGAGTAGITYTMPSGCKAVSILTVNTAPAAIAGAAHVCPGFTSSLTDATAGGTWGSSNSSIAAVGSSSGVVTAMTAGTAIISYILSNGCAATAIFTTDALPPAITGGPIACVGNSTLLSNAAGPGAWVSSNTAVAGINPTSGLVLGYALGTSTITFTSAAGCSTTLVISVNTAPAAITGASGVCQGQILTLSDITPGGTWSSSNTAIAVVGGTSGVVFGLNGGVVTISYALSSGCAAVKTVSVNTLPSAITGSASVCVGFQTTLSNATTGGTWTSSNISIATIGYTSGIVNGVSAGPAIITYTPISGCITTIIVTVNALPSVIAGASSVCVASTATVTNASTGGTWSSSNTGVATIGTSSGVFMGVSTGTSVITYTAGMGCWVVTTVTTHPSPVGISGPSTVCLGSSLSLSDITPGGSWSSTNTSVASIGTSTGILSSVALGTTTIIYTIGTGCSVLHIITVSPVPAAISGPSAVCMGSSITLANSVSGGTWSSNNTSVATAGTTSGIIGGVAAGTALITYTLPAGCYAVTTVTVNALPAPISGTLSICPGYISSLSSTPGGLWSSSNPGKGTIDASSGAVIGLSSGSATISYVLPTGCAASAVLTVNVLYPITGGTSVCAGQSTTLNNIMGSGTWSSGNIVVATVGSSSGIVTGNAAGTSIITFTYTAGCRATAVVTVNALSPITGSANLCIGVASTLFNTAPGGVWTSVNPSIASINASSGIVTGVATGTTTISYVYGSGCWVTTTVTVNSLPAPVSGPSNVCATNSITLSDATLGGTWSTAGYTGIASIGSTTGILTGIAAGTAVVTYALPTGCFSTYVVTVNALPSVIGGIRQVCVTATTLLTNTSPGGTWSSSNTSVAGIDAGSGVVSGISAGTAMVTYAVASGCFITTVVTVNSLPAAITGGLTVCVGSSSSLYSITPGGMWSSSNTAVASIGLGAGVLTGIASGTSVITYILPTGCASVAMVTVNALPAPITGPDRVCVAATITLSSTPGGGSWSTSASSFSVDGATGIVTGVSAGTGIVTYAVGTGCFITAAITVNPLPAGITGPASMCEAATATLACTTPGGTWSSSGPVAGINPTSGVVTAFIAGTAPITYASASGCIRTTSVTVNALPAPVVGALTVCSGQTTTFYDATPGGTWSSGTPGIATVNSTGLISGIAAGSAVITYTSAAGCIATKSLTVNLSPVAITGTPAVCAGLIVPLFNTTPAGTWSSTNTAVAAIGGSGTVAGITAGTSVVSYTLATGCAAEVIVTVNPLPASIVGPAFVCSGSTVSLFNASMGGSWSSSNIAAATVGAVTGDLMGLTPAAVTITYTLPTGCMATRNITVNPVPAPITGTAVVCQGYTTTLGNATPAGTWSSVIAGIASVGSTGIVAGMSDGIAMISYTLANGCAATLMYTVHPLAAINGPANACLGQTTNLSNLIAGGSWSSSNIATATVGSSSGVVYGVALGAATISYIMPTGCLSTKSITVNPVPAAIAGASSACMGATITLTNTTPGGMWSSSATTIAPVSATGVVSGLSAGSAAIVYVLSTGCASYASVTINPLYPIIGSSNVCGNDTITFTNAAPGGIWSSSTPGVAAVNSSSGLVTGVAPGTTLIRYLLSTGCLASMVVTVNTQPSVFSMTGGGGFCVGGSGVPVGLNSSSPSVNYKLFMGSTFVASYPGTGSALSFGVFSVAGTYTVLATSAVTGCTRNMSGAAVVSISPYNTPSVTVTTAGSICMGSLATFVPVPAFGGTAPAYEWKVNGVITGVGGGYSYVPASGDVVSCKLTSSAACLSTDTASGSMTVILTAPSVPAVSIAVTPGDTMCPLTTVTITPTPVNGGSAPWYNWIVNGISAGVSSTYSYAPINGDNVYCIMHSNQFCITSDTVSSNHKIFTVFPAISPTVTIIASPGFFITAGTSDTLIAVVSGGGSAPTYQWVVNGVTMPGATNATYVSTSFINGDSVSCVVTNTDICAGAPGSNHAVLTVKPGNHINGITNGVDLTSGLTLVPNPNAGIFTIHGPTGFHDEITLEVTDLLGQTVYKTVLNTHGQPLNSLITLDSRLANGMYMLNVYVGNERRNLHFVIEK